MRCGPKSKHLLGDVACQFIRKEIMLIEGKESLFYSKDLKK